MSKALLNEPLSKLKKLKQSLNHHQKENYARSAP